MKIVIKNIRHNAISALRRCGYHFERQHADTGEVSAALSLGTGGFPRFHAYARVVPSTSHGQAGGDLQINLHLDQKRPAYKGTSAHAGEYEGKLIEEEGARIKSILLLSR